MASWNLSFVSPDFVLLPLAVSSAHVCSAWILTTIVQETEKGGEEALSGSGSVMVSLCTYFLYSSVALEACGTVFCYS